MTHVEFDLTEAIRPQSPAYEYGSLEHWSAAAADASEACMVLDAQGTIIALSASASALLGFASVMHGVGRNLFRRALPLLDFTANGAALPDEEIHRIPPALALIPGVQARGVLRVRTFSGPTTIDAVSTPLRDGKNVVGSLTFFTVV